MNYASGHGPASLTYHAILYPGRNATKYKIYNIILWAKLLSKVARNHLADVRGNSRTHIPATFATINCSFNVLISSTGSIEVVGMDDGWMGEGAVCMSAVECRGTVQLRLGEGRRGVGGFSNGIRRTPFIFLPIPARLSLRRREGGVTLTFYWLSTTTCLHLRAQTDKQTPNTLSFIH